MVNKKERGFTLIELIAVLVIMAIIALIVTPLVMTIIRKARVSADKRSIDAYGRSIELAIAGYLLDNGKFPTSIEQLTIEYSGNEVVCSTTQLNSDSSVYLTGCTVDGRDVDYAYGENKGSTPTPTYTAYSVGDTVTYNNVQYRVIEDSSTSDANVTLLKAEPLSSEEITTYSAGTGAQTNGNGGMHYGSTSTYSTSYVKQAVDAWAQAEVPSGLQEARLLSTDDISSLGYEWFDNGSAAFWQKTESTPSWVYNSNYWTMTSYNDSTSGVWSVGNGGDLGGNDVVGSYCVVRPVIVLSKSVL